MPFKILSLDGGGSWALVQARVLQDIYQENENITGHDVLKKFDMVIANSGGSVLLGLLCNNMSLNEIITFYKTPSKIKKVFSPFLPWEKVLLKLFRLLFGAGPKYITRRKLEGLQEVISFDTVRTSKDVVNTYLHELPSVIGKNYQGKDVQLIIVGFDYFRERVTFFRSNIHSNTNKFSGKFYQITLGEAIHASSNAPVNYYEIPASVNIELLTAVEKEKDKRKSFFWDGAVAGFNNPVLAGLVEAVTNNAGQINFDGFYILSIGTGQKQKGVIADDKTSDNPEIKLRYEQNRGKPFVIDAGSFNLFKDIKKLSKSILSDPPDSATFIAYSFLNPGLENKDSRIVRINPFITPDCKEGIYDYPSVYQDDKNNFVKLMNLDFDATKEEELVLINSMCDRFIVNDKNEDCLQNQLIRGDINTNFLGYPTYRQAKERWKQLV